MIQIPLNIIVVKALSESPLTGYELIKRIKTETGYWKPSPGTIYPLLGALEKRGLVTSRQDGKKKIYTITAKAKIFLKLAEAKRAFMIHNAVCCFKTYKFLFGDDIVIPLLNEDDAIIPFFEEIANFRKFMGSSQIKNDPEKMVRAKKIIMRAFAEIKMIEREK